MSLFSSRLLLKIPIKKTCSYSMPKERIIPNPDYALIGYPDSFFILQAAFPRLRSGLGPRPKYSRGSCKVFPFPHNYFTINSPTFQYKRPFTYNKKIIMGIRQVR